MTAENRDRRDLLDISTELETLNLMIATLAESSCMAVTAKAIPDNFDAGLSNLFRYVIDQQEDIVRRLYVLATADDDFRASLPANRPRVMRDQFIADSIRQGYAVADVSQALGLPMSAVQRAMRRLNVTLPETPQAEAV